MWLPNTPNIRITWFKIMCIPSLSLKLQDDYSVMCWVFFFVCVCVIRCCRPRELSCVCCVCPWCHCSRWTMTGSCFCCLPCAMFCMLSSSTTLTPPSGFWKTAWRLFPVSFHSCLPLNVGKKTSGVVLIDYLSENQPAFKMKRPIWLWL